MDDLFITEQDTAGGKAPETEFYLATVTAWSNAAGVEIQLDGDSAPMTKRYKMMLMCRPLAVGMRVVVMKQSGTYIVLGEINLPNSWKRIDDLANSATLADVIAKINDLLAWLRTQGLLRT